MILNSFNYMDNWHTYTAATQLPMHILTSYVRVWTTLLPSKNDTLTSPLALMMTPNLYTWFGTRANYACAMPREREQNGGRGPSSTSGSGRTARSHTVELGRKSLRQTQKFQRVTGTVACKEVALQYACCTL